MFFHEAPGLSENPTLPPKKGEDIERTYPEKSLSAFLSAVA